MIDRFWQHICGVSKSATNIIYQSAGLHKSAAIQQQRAAWAMVCVSVITDSQVMTMPIAYCSAPWCFLGSGDLYGFREWHATATAVTYVI